MFPLRFRKIAVALSRAQSLLLVMKAAVPSVAGSEVKTDCLAGVPCLAGVLHGHGFYFVVVCCRRPSQVEVEWSGVEYSVVSRVLDVLRPPLAAPPMRNLG